MRDVVCGMKDGKSGKEFGKETQTRTRTPRLRAPVGTPGVTGVRRPDGRKPEACEGAGPGSGGVTGNLVAKSEREKHERHVSMVAELGSERCGCAIHGPGVTP